MIDTRIVARGKAGKSVRGEIDQLLYSGEFISAPCGSGSIGVTRVEKTGAGTHHKPDLVESRDTTGAIWGLPIREARTNVGGVDHSGQAGVPRTKFQR